MLPLEMNACLPGCVWNATPRSLLPLERNIVFWTLTIKRNGKLRVSRAFREEKKGNAGA